MISNILGSNSNLILMCDEYLLFSHPSPQYPLLQPFKQVPFMKWHCSFSKQEPQVFEQFWPYLRPSHSAKYLINHSSWWKHDIRSKQRSIYFFFYRTLLNKNLLSLQVGVFHPIGQPPSHNPVILSHLAGFPQLVLHFSSQL